MLRTHSIFLPSHSAEEYDIGSFKSKRFALIEILKYLRSAYRPSPVDYKRNNTLTRICYYFIVHHSRILQSINLFFFGNIFAVIGHEEKIIHKNF